MLTKCVNGIHVEMSAEEQDAIIAEWSAHDPAGKITEVVDPVQKLRAFLAANPDVANLVL